MTTAEETNRPHGLPLKIIVASLLVLIVSICFVTFVYPPSSFHLRYSQDDSYSNRKENSQLRSPDKTSTLSRESAQQFSSSKNSYNASPSNSLSESSFLSRIKDKVLNDIIPLTSNEVLRIRDVDSFNNVHLSPRLQSISGMDYFRFVKLNLKKKCTLWADDSKCSERYTPCLNVTLSSETTSNFLSMHLFYILTETVPLDSVKQMTCLLP